MKYVLFHSEGRHIGTLQTEKVEKYQVPCIVLDALPEVMFNVPATKIVMINEKENSVYLAEKPADPPKEPTETELLGAQLVSSELERLELKKQAETLGSQLVGMELRLLKLEAEKNVQK